MRSERRTTAPSSATRRAKIVIGKRMQSTPEDQAAALS
jgi:hypothetical protein